MDFNEGDYLINIYELKAAMLDVVMSADDEGEGADIQTYEDMLKAFRQCLEIITKYGSNMGA